MMKYFTGFFIIAAIITQSVSKTDYSYSAQNQWPGTCVTGRKQSPINVVTRNVQCSTSLTRLQLSNEYRTPLSGTFENKGHTVEFTPQSGTNAVMTTPKGKYNLVQVHMHWGAGQGQGSEHLVNGRASELEVHFVHQKQGVVDTTAPDNNAVLSVRGKAAIMFIDGIFKKLDVTNKVIKYFSSKTTGISVTGINLSELLPSSLDYYYYQGSLTTPDCGERVQWFLLKNTINVPALYLERLRKVNDNKGSPILFNYRSPQALNGRTVQQMCNGGYGGYGGHYGGYGGYGGHYGGYGGHYGGYQNK